MSQTKASIFESDGIPAFSKALPLALQHVVAMIVGCVTPAILISDAVSYTHLDVYKRQGISCSDYFISGTDFHNTKAHLQACGR